MQSADEYNGRQEIIKCVVVGDTAVGKTRLICARACNAFLTLTQMLTTHIPTVWAIDQYRIHKEVLRRSWMNVDGVSVSLRLWDTFGDHEKDRKFAYGRADVVILCFSISSILSFKHCKSKWFPEIQKFCPHVPIVLVGCKNDLRHIYRDDGFLEMCRERNAFVRIQAEVDLITREQGRELAAEIGAVYYEASVFTTYGVDTVFENAIRLALIARRQKRFWVKSLKNVTPPLLQVPYCPPKPRDIEFKIPKSTMQEDLQALLEKGFHSDAALTVGGKDYPVHRIILAAASFLFKNFFMKHKEEAYLKIPMPELEGLTEETIQSFLCFIYTGAINKKEMQGFLQAVKSAQAFELQNLIKKLECPDLEYPVGEQYFRKFHANLSKLCTDEKYYADVNFVVDDGVCPAHRSVLMARCEVMAAMFGGDFLEKTANTIPFPGVSKAVFEICLHYLYCDKVDERAQLSNCLPLIELANRLCLPRLITLLEWNAIEELETAQRNGLNVTEEVFRIMEPCQVHNADQLSDWCQHYVMIHYDDIATHTPKLLKSLHLDNQAYLNKNRWPPLYHMKEKEFYEKCVLEMQSQEKPPKQFWKSTRTKLNGVFRGPRRLFERGKSLPQILEDEPSTSSSDS